MVCIVQVLCILYLKTIHQMFYCFGEKIKYIKFLNMISFC